MKHFEYFQKGALQTSLPFSLLQIIGDDSISFIERLSTNTAPVPNTSNQHCILEKNAKIKFDFTLVRDTNKLFLIVSNEQASSLLEYFENLIFSEDISFKSLSQEVQIVYGSQAEQSLTQRDIAPPLPLQITNDLCFRFDICGEATYWLFQANNTLEDPSYGTPAITATKEVFEAISALQGYLLNCKALPFTESPLLETHLLKNKGCYPGQEIVSRILHQGKVSKSWKALIAPPSLLQNEIKEHGFKVLAQQTFLPDESKRLFLVMAKNDFDNQEWLTKQSAMLLEYPLYYSSSKQKNANAIFHSALKDFHNSNYKNALQDLILAKNTFPSEEILEAIAVCYERLEQEDSAMKANQILAKHFPESIMAHANLSRLLMKQGKIDAAENEQNIARELHFLNASKSSDNINLQLEKQKEELKQAQEKKAQLFRRVLGIDPDDDTALFGLGKYYIAVEQYSEACELLQKCITLYPNYSVAYPQLVKAKLAINAKEDVTDLISMGLAICMKNGDRMPQRHLELLQKQLQK